MNVTTAQAAVVYAEMQLEDALEKGDIQAVGDLLHYIASIDPIAAKRLLDVLNAGLKARGIK